MSLDQALPVFIEESRALLEEMEEGLLRLEQAPNDANILNAIFRAAHTIKGSAGLFGLDAIVSFTHVVENVLDRMRAGEIPAQPDLTNLLLQSCDEIYVLIDAAAVGTEADIEPTTTGVELLVRLSRYLETPGERNDAKCLPAKTPAPVEICGEGAVTGDSWHIAVDFGEDILRNGFDPASFIRYLRNLGDIVHLTTKTERLPFAEHMDPESCYLGFEIDFKSAADKKTIETVFEFVRDDCHIRITPPPAFAAVAIERIEALESEADKVGEILVKADAATPREIEEALALQNKIEARAHRHPPVGEILVQEGMLQQPVVEAALEKQKKIRDARAGETRLIRIHSGKLDQLINQVGELVIAGAAASLLAQKTNDSALQEALSTILRLVEEVRGGALQLRMVQIGETFNRFNRVVRDVSKELGKDIELQISGAETELDKTVVEKIGDPLTHLVRNAIDHGIEPTDRRIASGKPSKGTVRLNAYHESGSIVIEVSDDGGGLNRNKILSRAIERGLVNANQNLSEQEIYNLIFEPGFSTADKISNLSGRGVGMDVVRRNIEALRGSVEIASLEGRGSTIRIRLPLTLAIIDGFLVSVGGCSYVIPLDMVSECVELDEHQQHHGGYVNLRGEVLPILNLREHFRMHGKTARRQNIVVTHFGGQKAGLVVDELAGEFQTVIKPLGKLFGKARGVSGFTILGSGDVALILDVPSLIQRAANLEAQKVA
ncbi:chemotaxis protein CheA [Methylocaldum sp.]|uniref:chemotaxis protein CheA n=1 Tax=Methylocaldum sp. TaxID=1969727 RepID=UPI002D2B5709|nr:chemotaxis protein CheA [Methylocaldum sp.]HYE38113.1 chemotaxis protein CheA [Methylocaldum sp.]